MRKTNILFGFIALTLLACSSLTPAARAEREARVTQAVEKSLEDRHYTVEVQMMYPRTGRAINVTSNYSLEVKGDTVVSYLPYFGRAYDVPYGGGKGLNFMAPISRYNAEKDKKGRTHVTLVTDNQEDVITYELEILSSGQTTIDMHSRNREPISYSGELVVE